MLFLLNEKVGIGSLSDNDIRIKANYYEEI